ncbi:MAG: DUF4199 domain-containing protein [Rikenella sp.]|nr:DUF4199 domain-containing protein [Rikenella sp.]
MDEKLRKQKYRIELLTAGMVLGLAMVAVLLLQYGTRNLGSAFVAGALSCATLVSIVAVFVFYGRRAAALCPPDPAARPNGFTYGRAFGFSLLVSLLSGIVYGAGYFWMAEVVDPHYFGQVIDRATELYDSSGLMTAEQMLEMKAMMHNQWILIAGHMLAMAMQGGFVALFTSAVVRHRPNR